MNIQVGVVLSWNINNKTGWLRTGQGDSQRKLAFRLYNGNRLSGKYIIDGVDGPEFDSSKPTKDPCVGTQIVFTERKGVRATNVVDWSIKMYWDDSLRRIAARPQYRVMVVTEYNGVAGTMKEIEGATGTMEQLQKRSPRGSRNDEFAPVFSVGNYVDKRHFMRKEPDGRWVLCKDPRPAPFEPKKVNVVWDQPRVYDPFEASLVADLRQLHSPSYQGHHV